MCTGLQLPCRHSLVFYLVYVQSKNWSILAASTDSMVGARSFCSVSPPLRSFSSTPAASFRCALRNVKPLARLPLIPRLRTLGSTPRDNFMLHPRPQLTRYDLFPGLPACRNLFNHILHSKFLTFFSIFCLISYNGLQRLL